MCADESFQTHQSNEYATYTWPFLSLFPCYLLPLDLSRVSRGCQTCLLGNELAWGFGPRCRFVAIAYTLSLAETQAIVKDASMAWRLLRGRTRGPYTSSMPARRYIYCYCWNHTKPLASILHGLDYIQGYQGNIWPPSPPGGFPGFLLGVWHGSCLTPPS